MKRGDPTPTPVRFGAAPRALFGLHQPAQGAVDRAHAVVLCNPFGQEAIRCHRMMRVLAGRLARAGFHTLRFDYFATGDSDGDDGEADLETWIGDVVRAGAEAARGARCPRTSWFGLRLGGTLAALASARAPAPPDRLVLWDPVVDGAAYLAELDGLHAQEMANEAGVVEPRPPPPAAGRESLGFPIGERLAGPIAALTAASFAQVRASRMGLVHGTKADIRPLKDAAAQASVELRARAVDTSIVWASDEAMNTAIVPAEAVSAIIGLLAEDA